MIETAKLSWTEDGQPRSQAFEDIYFAQEDGMAETEAVFMRYNQLPERWQDQSLFTIGETGFGTGLNFLTCCYHFLQTTNSQKLRFISVEKFPLSLSDLTQAHRALPSALQPWAEALQNLYPPALPGLHQIRIHSRIECWLLIGEASEMLSQLMENCLVDAWFLDGFAPAKNPDMWSDKLFRQLANHSHQTTTLATFTAASQVRKGLTAVGFNMNKAPGFGRKREMLYGHYTGHPTHLRRRIKKQNWLPTRSQPLTKGAHIAVIGAGIAGATTANRLAEAGFKVSVFESNDRPAQAASGNIAGNCLPVIANDHMPYAQWYWQSWRTARHWWLQQDNKEQLGNFNGAYKWEKNDQQLKTWQHWQAQINNPHYATWRQLPNGKQAALFLPQAGYFRPQQVVQRLLENEHIHCHYQTHIHKLTYQETQWQLHTPTHTFSADGLVIANGAQFIDLYPEWTPFLQRQKGQVTHLHTDYWQHPPQHALSYRGYATPAINELHAIGATFEKGEPLGINEAGHFHNIQLLHADHPNALKAKLDIAGGHSAYRMMTPDHLPLVGNLVDVIEYQQRMQKCALHPDTCPEATDICQPYAWLNIGHGSRGLTSSFLAAELLLAQITSSCAPITQSLVQAVHPTRGVFRHLAKHKRSTPLPQGLQHEPRRH